MKPSTARELIAVVQAAYPRQPWPAPTVALYAQELERLPLDEQGALDAVRRMLRARTSEWAPTIAEILATIIEAHDAAPSFAAAWVEMMQRASTGNYFRPEEPPELSHPAITALARVIGWGVFCRSDPSDSYFRHRAEGLYADVTSDRIRAALNAPSLIAALGPGDVDPAVRELASSIGESV